MKIANARTGVIGTPWRNIVMLELQTDEGVTGVGETRVVNHTDAVLGYLKHGVASHVKGSDPFEIESLVQHMFRADYARAGEIAMSAIAAIELACWDIVGKTLEQPVHRLLGGAVRRCVKAYANGWYTVDRTPESFHAAARAVLALGYRAVKLDPFGNNFLEMDRAGRRHSLNLVEAVRDAIGPDTELMIEMHGRFTPTVAISIANDLAPLEPAWIEEPVPPENVKALAKVAAHVDVPLATGERIHTRFDFRELLELQAADILQPDITQFGGLLETRKLAATAETHYMLIAPHNVGGPIATAAGLHLAACTPNFKTLEHFNDFADPWLHDVVRGLPRIDEDGYFSLPTGPGLGVTIDWDGVAAHPREHHSFDLFAEDWHRRRARAI